MIMSELTAVQDLDETLLFNGNDPDLFFKSVNYLDPQDPIERLLIGFGDAVMDDHDRLPTESEQMRLINGVRHSDLQSAHELVDSHSGIIAAVAYPFKCAGIDAKELLGKGARAIVKAAKTYDRYGPLAFSDHAVTLIHEAFRDDWPEQAGDSFVDGQERPMARLYCFASTLMVADTPQKLAEKERLDSSRFNHKLTYRDIEILRLLNLENKQIALELGLNKATVSHRLSEIKAKLGVDNREAAALEMFRRGMVFDLPDIPEREAFSVQERQVAMRLTQSNKLISQELGLSKRQLDRVMNRLYGKTGARTRAELVVLAHLHDFEPTEEELNPPLPKTLSPLQVEICQRMIYQQDHEMADEMPVSISTIQKHAERMVAENGLYDRTQLILELYRQGMEFDVIDPERPLTEILTAHEIDIVRCLDMPYEQIAEAFGYDDRMQINNIVSRLKAKTGARSRHELALLVEMIDEANEEPLEMADYSTNEWRLAQRLGLKTLQACDIDTLILEAYDQDRAAIRAYYLAEKAVQMSTVSEMFGISLPALRSRLTRGIKAMKNGLESYQEAEAA